MTSLPVNELIEAAEAIMSEVSVYQQGKLKKAIAQARAGSPEHLEKRLEALTVPDKSDSAVQNAQTAPDTDSAETAQAVTTYGEDDLPDDYVEPETDEELIFQAVPGFHISPYRDNHGGMTKMLLRQVRPLLEGDTRIMPYELARTRVNDKKILCCGEYALGIETENHYKQRYEAMISRPARNLTRNTPVSPHVKDGSPEVTYAKIEIVAPNRQ